MAPHVRPQPVGGAGPRSDIFGPIGGIKQFSKAFGLLNSKRIFREKGKVFCKQHMRELVYKTGYLSDWHKCDMCKKLLKDLENGEFYDCRTCDLDFCLACLTTDQNFGHL